MKTHDDGSIWVSAPTFAGITRPARKYVEVAVQTRDMWAPVRITMTATQARRFVAQVERAIKKAEL